MPTNQVGIDHLFSWEGDVGRTVLARTLEFEDVVRLNAPFRPAAPGPHLVGSIGHLIVPTVGRLEILVGANPDSFTRGYAAIVHEGSRPHPIMPRPPNKFLKFRVGGRTVYARRVFHPGTQPDPFLMRWIGIILGR